MNFLETLQKPIKEREAFNKIGFYFLANFVLFLILIPVVLIGIIPILGWLILCFGGIFLMAAFVILNNNYFYEYAKAGMEDRETNKIWEMEQGDLFRKAGKLFLVQLIYSIPLIVISTMLSFGQAFLDLMDPSDARTFLYIILIFCYLVYYLISIVYNFYVSIPAQLQLIKTHTFSEAFKFRKLYENSIKNRTYNMVILWQVVISFAALAIVGVNFFLTFLLVGICLWPFIIIALLIYSEIMLPYAIGKAYVSK